MLESVLLFEILTPTIVLHYDDRNLGIADIPHKIIHQKQQNGASLNYHGPLPLAKSLFFFFRVEVLFTDLDLDVNQVGGNVSDWDLQIIATELPPVGNPPQMVVKSKGMVYLKMPETFRFRNYGNLPR